MHNSIILYIKYESNFKNGKLPMFTIYIYIYIYIYISIINYQLYRMIFFIFLPKL